MTNRRRKLGESVEALENRISSEFRHRKPFASKGRKQPNSRKAERYETRALCVSLRVMRYTFANAY